jgi:16S rRNA (guanine1516-N2)-methyltransferase
MSTPRMTGLTSLPSAAAPAREAGRELRLRLGVPELAADDPAPGLRLWVDAGGLALCWRRAGSSSDALLRVDLLAAVGRRTLGPGTPLVARALGVDRSEPEVVDATAGLGRDAVVLARCGARITMLERDPVLTALLADGLRRLAESDPDLAARLELIETDATDWLRARAAAGPPLVDAVLIDPMFPARRGSALPRLEMQVFRELLGAGDPDDTRALLAAARAACTRRAVVKRPPRERPVAPGATTTLRGPRARFDVYPPKRSSAAEPNT